MQPNQFDSPARPVSAGAASRPVRASVLAGALTLALVAPAAAWGQGADFSWRGALEEGQTIEIKGVNGAIRASSAAGSEVEVTAAKRARRSDPNEVRIEVVTHEGGVTICAVYPTPSGQRENECRPGGEGRMETRNNDVSVEFTVYVPEGVHFAGRTVNGEIEAVSLPRDADLNTVNGGIKLTTRGFATANTVNGSITATIGRADWDGALRFKTVNGGIRLNLPDAIAAEFDAQTVNGSISTDFPVQVQGRFGPRQLRGTIGDGGPRRLEVQTVNGSIEIRRAT
jgi:hypothetical protein